MAVKKEGQGNEPWPWAIQKGIPIPQHRSKRSKYPWDQMEVGDSFFVPETVKSPRIMTTTASGAGQRRGWTFTTRRVIEGGVQGLRIWRVK